MYSQNIDNRLPCFSLPLFDEDGSETMQVFMVVNIWKGALASSHKCFLRDLKVQFWRCGIWNDGCQRWCLAAATLAALCIQWSVAEPNVALHASASQQSTYFTTYASLAVDGNYYSESCTTTSNVRPWWAADLGYPRLIKAVNVTNDWNIYFRE